MKIVRRNSRQRERIYELIKASSSHPTAQWIYDTLKKEMPSLSLGNVYRNIKILMEEGRIKSREFGDGIEHYDAIVETHYHFVCDNCGGVSDFSMPLQNGIIEKAQKISRHSISGHTIQFFGICELCKKSKDVRKDKQKQIKKGGIK